jgi:hypothetical protein
MKRTELNCFCWQIWRLDKNLADLILQSLLLLKKNIELNFPYQGYWKNRPSQQLFKVLILFISQLHVSVLAGHLQEEYTIILGNDLQYLPKYIQNKTYNKKITDPLQWGTCPKIIVCSAWRWPARAETCSGEIYIINTLKSCCEGRFYQ